MIAPLLKHLAKSLLLLGLSANLALAQGGHPTPSPPPPGAKSTKCSSRPIPQLEDITAKTGITFKHTSDPAKKYIVESMSGGVIVFDYDRDGWPDIYFTNAPSVEMALKGQKAPGKLYHNNHDGTFTDVSEKSGLNSPCFAMGGAVGDYDNDGWPALYLTCFGGNVLYHNNGDGTFTDVTSKAGVADGRWSTGASFGDYDGDGFLDLMVTNYVDFHLDDLPGFGKAPNCKYRGIDVQCGPRGLKGAGDTLFHNNGNGTFTDVSKAAGVSDPNGYHGLSVVWADFNNTGRPDITSPMIPRRNFSTKTWGMENFKISASSLARPSAKTAPSKLPWASPSGTIYMPAGLRCTPRISPMRMTRCIATTAIGISRTFLMLPGWRCLLCRSSSGARRSSIWIMTAGSISSP